MRLSEEFIQKIKCGTYKECDYLVSEYNKTLISLAINTLINAINEKSYKMEEDYDAGEYARIVIWEDDLQQIVDNIRKELG